MDAKMREADFLSQWMDIQKSFYDQWLNACGQFFRPRAGAGGGWPENHTGFPGADLFTRWNEMIRDTVRQAAGAGGTGIGPDVLFRILRSSDVFVLFNQFWLEILRDLPRLYQSPWDDGAARQIFDRWTDRYRKVFEQIVGSPMSQSAEEMMTSWLNTMQMGQAGAGLLWQPWFKTLPQWQALMGRLMRGDTAALAESRSLWREVYDETLGKIFRMPALGISREQTEKARRTYDAFIHFWNSVPGFYQFFYKTGLDALREFYERLRHLKPEEMTPERLREVYKIWWTTNENAFFELFKRPEFGRAMSEVLNYGMALKKRLDDMAAEWCRALGIPAREDFDQLAKAVHDLRRSVRRQAKAIEELKQKLELSAAGRDPGSVSE